MFGTVGPGLHRPRNHNIENLWRRALGNMPGERTNPGELFEQWRRVIDRFQTNLADWTEEEDEVTSDSNDYMPVMYRTRLVDAVTHLEKFVWNIRSKNC